MRKTTEMILVAQGNDEILRSPGSKQPYYSDALWDIGCYEFSNRMALKAARFIARWNGYELVKKKEKK